MGGHSLLSTFFEIPKSEILIPPLLSTNILAPLISRCMISLACRYSRPVRICRTNRLTRASSNAPYLFRRAATDPPGTYSRKIL
jgi:hypothetical protein